MNRNILGFFKSFSVLRFISVAMLFIIDELEFRSSPRFSDDNDLFSFFSTWELALIGAIGLFVIFNCIYTLLISYKPKVIFTNFLGGKFFTRLVYCIELILFPVIAFRVASEVKNVFFYANTISMESFWNFRSGNMYDKASVLDACLYVICSFEFLLFFWRVVSIRKLTLARSV